MPSGRALLVGLAAGLLHAALLVAVALELGYEVGPTDYSFVGATWRYGGLVVVAALPVWLAVRHRVVVPLVLLVVVTGYVLGMELTPPGPTFRDVAEVERLSEPTGIVVVENGLYVVRYMVNASVWVVGFLFAGLTEYAARTSTDALPAVTSAPAWLTLQGTRQDAAVLAAALGLVHATVMVWFAVRLGVTASGGFEAVLYLYGAVGTWLLAAVPLYLLVRHGLVAPAALLSALVLFDAFAEFSASVEDPHALYFGAWFFFLGVLLVVAGVEWGLRRGEVLGWAQSLG
jgi:hypothetical protein